MKKWNSPVVEELNINETAHRLFGNTRDGGYIGDGQVSGHLGWKGEDDTEGTTGENTTEMLS